LDLVGDFIFKYDCSFYISILNGGGVAMRRILSICHISTKRFGALRRANGLIQIIQSV